MGKTREGILSISAEHKITVIRLAFNLLIATVYRNTLVIPLGTRYRIDMKSNIVGFRIKIGRTSLRDIPGEF